MPRGFGDTQDFDTEMFYWNSPATFQSVAITSCTLGLCIGAGLTNAWYSTWGYPQLWLYICVYCYFHLAEFLVTAHYNPKRVSMASFLLANGWEYFYATLASVLEATVTHVFAPRRHTVTRFTYIGIVLIIVGQTIRTKSMIQAAQSFNHRVQFQKNEDHELVTTGIYSRMRHPSYCGYYLWTVGTQLLLWNVGCTVAFSAILWYFFKLRIEREEIALLEFFEDKYLEYKKRVGSGLPFIR